MNQTQIETLIEQHYPGKVLYLPGKRKRLGNNPTRYKHLLGSSLDRLFSVEMFGRPTKLKLIKFMMPYDGPAKEKGATAVAKILNDLYPENGKGEWLLTAVREIQPDGRLHKDKVGVEVVNLAGINVMFVTVK